MIDFSLTEEQQALQELARKFAREEMAPKAAHHDETGEFPARHHRGGLAITDLASGMQHQRPVREEQEQFRHRADFRFRIQEHLAQLPAQRAPAGLARHQHLMVQGAEHVGEVLDERGFARALNAF